MGLWIYSIFSFIHFSDENYVGKILEITQTSIVVDDGKIWSIEIQYNETTKILPKNTENILSVWSPVFVGTRKDQDGFIQADFIRFIDEKRLLKNK